MIQYSLEVALCWSILYLIYISLMRRETFFNINRWFIIGSLVGGLIIPLLKLLPAIFTSSTIAIVEPLEFIAAAPAVVAIHFEPVQDAFNWQYMLLVVYVIGALFMLARLCTGLFKIWKLYHKGIKIVKPQFTIVETDTIHLPFSFLQMIFISKHVELTKELDYIMKHELTHIVDRHTYDVLFIEILHVLFWWNPLIYLFKKELRQIHEYLADAMVLRDTNHKMYGHILLRQSNSGLEIALAHSFFHSHIKQRFNMMNQKQSSRPALVKYLTAVPVMVLMILLFSNAKNSDSDPAPFKETVLAMLNKNTSFDYISSDVQALVVTYIQDHKMDPEMIKADLGEVAELTGVEILIELEGDELDKFCVFKDYSKTTLHPADMVIGEDSITDPPAPPSPPSPPNVLQYLGKKASPTTPLFVVDGEIVDPQDIRKPVGSEVFAMRSLTDMSSVPATVKYGEKGKNGAFVIEGISYKIVTTDPKVYKVVDEMPRFPGCEDVEGTTKEKEDCAKKKMLQYIYQNLRYPALAREKGVEGICVVQFVISDQGDIQDAELLRNIGEGCGDAVLKVVNSMNHMSTKWTSGKQEGESVNVLYTLPVRFKLSDDEKTPCDSISPPPPPPPPPPTNIIMNHSEEKDAVFKVVEQMPRFPGCEDMIGTNKEKEDCAKQKMLKYIYTHLKYPSEARDAGVEGMNVVQFEINSQGSVQNINLVRDIGSGTSDATIKVIEEMESKVGKWTPGKVRGKAVTVLYTLPVKFKLAKDANNILLVVNGLQVRKMSEKDIKSILEIEKDNIATIDILKGGDETEKYGEGYDSVYVMVTKEKLNLHAQSSNQLVLENMKVYPNPTSNLLNLKFNSISTKPVSVTVFTLSGSVIYKQTDNAFDGNYNQAIDISTAPSGVVILTIEQEAKVTSQVIMKK